MHTSPSFAQKIRFRCRLSVERLEDRLVPGETLTGLLLLPAQLSPPGLAAEQRILTDDTSTVSIVERSSDIGQPGLLSDADAPATLMDAQGTEKDGGGQVTGSGSTPATTDSGDDSTRAASAPDMDFWGSLGSPSSSGVAPAAVAGNAFGMPAIGQAATARGTDALPLAAPTISLANSGATNMADLVQSASSTLARGAVAASDASSGANFAQPNLLVRPAPTGGPGPATSFGGYSPAQIKTAYGVDKLSASGSGVTIAIVDAYQAPNIVSDLNSFDSRFGLPAANLVIVQPQGRPRINTGWAQEITLDVEWAHAMAPSAKIVLEEAKTNSFSNLLGAVDDAVNNQGAQVVSMSWSGGDSSSDTTFDSHFNPTGKNVTFLASAGDTGGAVGYPATSPYVLAAGGTSLPFDSNGNPVPANETAWSSGGGGPSTGETEPGYQTSFGITITGGKRGTPDISSDSDPNTGVLVVYNGGLYIFGGTSVAAPTLAGEIALADQGRSTALSLNGSLASSPEYNAATGSLYASNYRDITTGSNGHPATTGYDLATGLGSPQANNLVPYLNTH